MSEAPVTTTPVATEPVTTAPTTETAAQYPQHSSSLPGDSSNLPEINQLFSDWQDNRDPHLRDSFLSIEKFYRRASADIQKCYYEPWKYSIDELQGNLKEVNDLIAGHVQVSNEKRLEKAPPDWGQIPISHFLKVANFLKQCRWRYHTESDEDRVGILGHLRQLEEVDENLQRLAHTPYWQFKLDSFQRSLESEARLFSVMASWRADQPLPSIEEEANSGNTQATAHPHNPLGGNQYSNIQQHDEPLQYRRPYIEDGQPRDGQLRGEQPQGEQPRREQPQGEQPRREQSQGEQPQDGQPQDGQPQDGQPQDGQPQDGQPQGGQYYGQPQDGQYYGQLQHGQPQDGQPQDGQPQDGQPQDGQPQDGQPQDGLYYGQPPDGQPQDGQPLDGQPQDGQPYYGQFFNGQYNGQPANGQYYGRPANERYYGEQWVNNGGPFGRDWDADCVWGPDGQLYWVTPDGQVYPLDQPQGQPQDGQPQDGQPQDGQPDDGQPDDGQGGWVRHRSLNQLRHIIADTYNIQMEGVVIAWNHAGKIGKVVLVEYRIGNAVTGRVEPGRFHQFEALRETNLVVNSRALVQNRDPNTCQLGEPQWTFEDVSEVGLVFWDVPDEYADDPASVLAPVPGVSDAAYPRAYLEIIWMDGFITYESRWKLPRLFRMHPYKVIVMLYHLAQEQESAIRAARANQSPGNTRPLPWRNDYSAARLARRSLSAAPDRDFVPDATFQPAYEPEEEYDSTYGYQPSLGARSRSVMTTPRRSPASLQSYVPVQPRATSLPAQPAQYPIRSRQSLASQQSYIPVQPRATSLPAQPAQYPIRSRQSPASQQSYVPVQSWATSTQPAQPVQHPMQPRQSPASQQSYVPVHPWATTPQPAQPVQYPIQNRRVPISSITGGYPTPPPTDGGYGSRAASVGAPNAMSAAARGKQPNRDTRVNYPTPQPPDSGYASRATSVGAPNAMSAAAKGGQPNQDIRANYPAPPGTDIGVGIPSALPHRPAGPASSASAPMTPARPPAGPTSSAGTPAGPVSSSSAPMTPARPLAGPTSSAGTPAGPASSTSAPAGPTSSTGAPTGLARRLAGPTSSSGAPTTPARPLVGPASSAGAPAGPARPSTRRLSEVIPPAPPAFKAGSSGSRPASAHSAPSGPTGAHPVAFHPAGPLRTAPHPAGAGPANIRPRKSVSFEPEQQRRRSERGSRQPIWYGRGGYAQ